MQCGKITVFSLEKKLESYTAIAPQQVTAPSGIIVDVAVWGNSRVVLTSEGLHLHNLFLDSQCTF